MCTQRYLPATSWGDLSTEHGLTAVHFLTCITDRYRGLYKSILAVRDVANRKRHFAAVERQMMCANSEED